jgi:hypothetical protein
MKRMANQKHIKRRKSLDHQDMDNKAFFTARNSIDRKENDAFFVRKAGAEEEEMQTSLHRQEEEEETQAKMMRKEEEEIQAGLMRQEEEEIQASEKSQHDIQRQEDDEMQMKRIQKKEKNVPGPTFESDLESAKKGGTHLPDDVRKEMEDFFGRSLGHVQIHDDETSAALCEQINAQAFTHGNHIFFNKGKYQPGTTAGKHLLTHELTHIIQQKEL